jgi:hypothetical protein
MASSAHSSQAMPHFGSKGGHPQANGKPKEDAMERIEGRRTLWRPTAVPKSGLT